VQAWSIVAQADHRDLDGRPALRQARLLEVPQHEGVVALLLGQHAVADGRPGAAELAEQAQVPVGRREAVNLELKPRGGPVVQAGLKARDVRPLLRRIDEALVPDAAGGLGHGHVSSVGKPPGGGRRGWDGKKGARDDLAKLSRLVLPAAVQKSRKRRVFFLQTAP
jgi:hypothetical protein